MAVHAHLVQDGQHGAIGLASAGWCADEHVFGGKERRFADARLNAVEGFHALEGGLGPLGQAGDLPQLLACEC